MGKASKRIILFLVSFSVSTFVIGQFNLGFEESFEMPFDQNGNLRLATTGGFSNPQFSEIDLNQDGTLDLFVFDRATNIWKTFLYNDNQSRYDYAPQYESQFPKALSNMVLLRDYNCDGHPDIFDYRGGAFRVNTCTAQNPWEFELTTEAIQSDYGSTTANAFLLPGDVPAIIDIDLDGDMDILAFGNGDAENTIVLHENQSQDEYGNCDSLEFVVATECWGGVEEPPNSSVLEAIACRPEITPPINWQHQSSRFHPGSTILFTDTDDDGDYDLALGDIQTTSFVFAPNIGSAGSPEIDIANQTTDFPNGTNPGNMQYMLAGYNIDIDHDGQKDLIATTNNTIDSSCNAGHVWSYDNTASSGASYSLSDKAFLIGDMLDLGTGIVPLVIDIDGDGLDDIIFASDYYRSPDEYKSSRLYYFKNTGSSSSPNFKLSDEDFASLSQYNFQAAYPALGDLDGDQDVDLIIGDLDGNLHYFRNDEVGGEADFVLASPNYMGINSIGQYAAPHLFDFNDDGLLDLLVGERVGTMGYFENTGTSSAAQYSSSATIPNFGKIDVSQFCCNGFAAPQIIDREEFGVDRYVFVGSDERKIFIYKVSSNLSDSFALIDSLVIMADRITPVFHDFDDDGIIELLTGTGSGGSKYFDRSENFKVGIQSPVLNLPDFVIFPNPANNKVQLKLDKAAQYQISLIGVDGKIWHQRELSGAGAELDIAKLPAAVYIVAVEGKDFYSLKKLVITH